MPYTYSIKTQYNITVENNHSTASLRVEQYDSVDEATATDPKLLVEQVRSLSRKYTQTDLESLSIRRLQRFSITKYNDDDDEDSTTTEYSLWFNQAQKRSKTREVVLYNLIANKHDKWFEETKSGETIDFEV